MKRVDEDDGRVMEGLFWGVYSWGVRGRGREEKGR